jgi:hypothetical protein
VTTLWCGLAFLIFAGEGSVLYTHFHGAPDWRWAHGLAVSWSPPTVSAPPQSTPERAPVTAKETEAPHTKSNSAPAAAKEESAPTKREEVGSARLIYDPVGDQISLVSFSGGISSASVKAEKNALTYGWPKAIGQFTFFADQGPYKYFA